MGTRLVWNRVPEFAEISQTAMPTVMHSESMMALHKRIPQWVNRYRFGRDHLSTNVRFPSNADRKFSA